LRWQEVYGLPASAIGADFVDVWQVLEGRGAARALRDYPKGHRRRSVPIGTPELAAELAAHAEEVRAARGRDGLMFTTSAGTSVDYNNHRRSWDALMAATTLEAAPGFHGLRHTYGSELAAAGVPRSEIAVLMGHADESTTAVYIHEGEDGARRDTVRAVFAKRAAKPAPVAPTPAKVRHLQAVS
jgi:integrase